VWLWTFRPRTLGPGPAVLLPCYGAGFALVIFHDLIELDT
jgi:hypothetical protein